MGKRNKIRYQSTPKARVAITLTGKVFLQYVDEDEMAAAQKGDLLLYPYNEALHTNRLADYESTGFTGYFKVDVHDGREWKPLLMTGVFSDNEHYFGKKERPMDTYHVCADILRALAGRTVVRSYREHYELEEAGL